MPPVATTTEALGQSDAFLEFMERLSAAAAVDRPVLIVGERGTGKELVARRLHYLSRRWDMPLAALNCSALPAELVESELFGHEPGAFTGATARRKGRFEATHGGTLFLDEIGTMPLTVQEKILRVVEYGQFERVGGALTVQTDVRIVGATNVDLPALAEAGRFKRDLLDRLSFEVLTLPPLRARFGDIELLARHFATQMAIELGRDEAPEFTPRALKALGEHPWPGNVRELKNVVERALYRSRGNSVEAIDLDPFASPWRPEADQNHSRGATPRQRESSKGLGPDLSRGSATGQARTLGEEPAWPVSIRQSVAELELGLLEKALDATRHNQRRAAELLGLSYHQFRGLYRKHNESPKQV